MIVWIDDEERKISGYLDELEFAHLDVNVQTNVDKAVLYLSSNKEMIDLCILDITIAPGELFKATDTLLGRRTGIHLFEYIRRLYPRLPFIVLTNVNAPDVQMKFDQEDNCWWFRKDQLLPYELVEEIRQILATPENPDGGECDSSIQ